MSDPIDSSVGVSGAPGVGARPRANIIRKTISAGPPAAAASAAPPATAADDDCTPEEEPSTHTDMTQGEQTTPTVVAAGGPPMPTPAPTSDVKRSTGEANSTTTATTTSAARPTTAAHAVTAAHPTSHSATKGPRAIASVGIKRISMAPATTATTAGGHSATTLSSRRSLAPTHAQPAAAPSAHAVAPSSSAGVTPSAVRRSIAPRPSTATPTAPKPASMRPGTAAANATAAAASPIIGGPAASSSPSATTRSTTVGKSPAPSSRLLSSSASAAAAAIRRKELAEKTTSVRTESVTSKLSKLKPILAASKAASQVAVSRPTHVATPMTDAANKSPPRSESPTPLPPQPTDRSIDDGEPASTTEAPQPAGATSAAPINLRTSSAAAAAATAVAAADHALDDELDRPETARPASDQAQADGMETASGGTSADSSPQRSPIGSVVASAAASQANTPPDSPHAPPVAHVIEASRSAVPPLHLAPMPAAAALPVAESKAAVVVAWSEPVAELQSQVAALQQQLAAVLQIQQQQQQIHAGASAPAPTPAPVPAPMPAVVTIAPPTPEQVVAASQEAIGLAVAAAIETASATAAAASAIQIQAQVTAQVQAQTDLLRTTLQESIHASAVASLQSLLVSTLAEEKLRWSCDQHDATMALLDAYESATRKEQSVQDQLRQDQYETDTIRVLADIRAVQTQVGSTAGALVAHEQRWTQVEERLVGHSEQMKQLAMDGARQQAELEQRLVHDWETRWSGLSTQLAALAAQVDSATGERQELQAMIADHSLRMGDQKKATSRLERITQEHAERMGEWEHLVHTQSVKIKAHEEWIQQKREEHLQAPPPHGRTNSVGANASTGSSAAPSGVAPLAPIPALTPVPAPVPSVSGPSIGAFESLRRDHDDLKQSYAGAQLQLDQLRSIVLKMIARDSTHTAAAAAGGLDMIAALMTPFTVAPPAPTSATAAAAAAATADGIEARWAARYAARAAVKAGLVGGATAEANGIPLPPGAHSRQASATEASGGLHTRQASLTNEAAGVGSASVAASPLAPPPNGRTQPTTPTNSVTRPAAVAGPNTPAPGALLLQTPSATPNGSPRSSTLTTPSASSSSGALTLALDAAGHELSKRHQLGIWASPAKAKSTGGPSRASPSAGVQWQVHFHPAKTPLRSPPPRVQMQLQAGTGIAPSATPVRTTATPSNTDDLPASSARRKSHLRSQMQGHRPINNEEEFVLAPIHSDY